MAKNLDYYEVLGVSKTASLQEIKTAYRRLAKKYHPDVSSEANAQEKFKEVSQAYQILSDPEKRQQHDQELNSKTIFFDYEFKTSSKTKQSICQYCNNQTNKFYHFGNSAEFNYKVFKHFISIKYYRKLIRKKLCEDCYSFFLLWIIFDCLDCETQEPATKIYKDPVLVNKFKERGIKCEGILLTTKTPLCDWHYSNKKYYQYLWDFIKLGAVSSFLGILFFVIPGLESVLFIGIICFVFVGILLLRFLGYWFYIWLSFTNGKKV